jgi:hypothetical protein
MPIMATEANVFRESIVSNARPSGSTNVSVPAGGTIVGLGNGQISINGAVQTVSNININSNHPGVTLVGDFTGINAFVQNHVTLHLGSATQPFVVNDTSGSGSYIATGGSININVTDGLVMENVSVGALNGGITFDSPGTPGNVSMGATFISQGQMTGTIRASGWNTEQMPQFYGHQQLTMNMIGVGGIEMGGLFFSSGGAHMSVTVNNGGADFDGLFFSNHSGSGSMINGHTNIKMPSRFPSMPMLERLRHWLVNELGGGSCSCPIPPSCTCPPPPGCPCPLVPDCTCVPPLDCACPWKINHTCTPALYIDNNESRWFSSGSGRLNGLVAWQ